MAPEEVMAPEGDEGLLPLSFLAHQGDFHRLFPVVVPDGMGHPTKVTSSILSGFINQWNEEDPHLVGPLLSHVLAYARPGLRVDSLPLKLYSSIGRW